MKEIKFRAWDEVLKKMGYVSSIEFTGGEITTVDIKHPDPVTDTYRVSRTSKSSALMQFTGLHDKNGKEIFEGDVVLFVEDEVVEYIGGHPRTEPEGKFRTIEWNQLYCAWGLFENGGQSKDMLADWINDDGSTPKQWECKDLEVIGNIYENLDLLT